MPYTFAPEEKHAKAYGSNLRISPKTGHLICNMIKRKKFNVAKSMLEDMYAGKRSMKGKYYTKTVKEMLDLLASCEKNAQVLGLDMDKVIDVMSGGAAGNWFLAHRGKTMLAGKYAPGFKVHLHHKDLNIIRAMLGRLNGVSMPLGEMTLEHYQRLMAEGHGDEDISALYRLKAPR